jgi:hypothetical protein
LNHVQSRDWPIIEMYLIVQRLGATARRLPLKIKTRCRREPRKLSGGVPSNEHMTRRPVQLVRERKKIGEKKDEKRQKSENTTPLLRSAPYKPKYRNRATNSAADATRSKDPRS